MGSSNVLKVPLWLSPSNPNLQHLELLLITRVLCWPHFTALLAKSAVELSIPETFPTSTQAPNPPLTPRRDALTQTTFTQPRWGYKSSKKKKKQIKKRRFYYLALLAGEYKGQHRAFPHFLGVFHGEMPMCQHQALPQLSCLSFGSWILSLQGNRGEFFGGTGVLPELIARCRVR